MVELVLHCKDGEETAVGERFCEELKGNEAFRNNDIVVNYDDHKGKVVIWLGQDCKSIFRVDASGIICGNIANVK